MTGRKQMEVQKAEALRLLDTLLTRAPVGFLFLDRDLRFVRINEWLAEMNGLPIAAHLGKSVAEILPTLEPALREVTSRILTTGQPVLDHEFAGETARAPGVTRYWCESWYPVRDEGDEIIGFGAVVEDITERREAEAALRLSNERFDLAVTCSQAVLCQQDLDLRYTWLHNPAPGIDGLEAVGKKDEDLLERAEDAAVIVALKREVIRSGVGLRAEFSPQIQGVIHCFDVLLEPLRDAAGRITGITGAAINISERKRAEEALQANKEHMRLANAATGVGIWEWNVITNAIRWDAQMFRIYGVPPTADGLVTYETWSRAVLPEDLARQEEVLADTVNRLGNSTREFRILRADNGECRWIQSVETVSANEEGKAEWVIGTNLDGTARKNAERAIREEAQRKDEFLAMLGHELRNPLNAIRNAVQIGLEAPQDRDACQWASSVIDRQSQQLSRMVDDLLDVARINRGRIELRVAALDLGPVLEQAIAVVRPLLTRRRQTFTSDIGSQLRVTGDAPRLEQVFVNLLTNAVKYTPDNGRISLHARNEDGEVVVAIADNGAGISAELLPHIFDLFRQADSTLDRALGGLGIGLSVVKSLVEMHFGQVRVESAGTNAGATATVRLPALLDWPAAESPPAVRVIDTAPPRPVRVLIVDDHIDAAESLETLLQRRGCEVRRAHSGPAGVAAARDFNPEVLLLDLGLPGFDGYEVARILRAEAPFTDALFIAISGYAQDGDRQRCLASGFDDHFPKPLDLKKLLQVIHSRPDQAPVTQRHFPPCAPAAGPP